MSASAASAVSSSRAATAATGSPTKRTLSRQSACSSWLTGRIPKGMGNSEPTSVASTPGWPAARETSMERMRACGCGERSSRAKAMRGRTRSSAKTVCPVTLAAASTLTSGWPTTVRSWRFSSGTRPPHPVRRHLDGLEYLQVPGTPAQVPRRRLRDLLPRRRGLVRKQGGRGQQETRGAVPALSRPQRCKRLLKRMQGDTRHAFDGRDLAVLALHGQGQARKDRAPVHEHRAGAAFPQLASVLGAHEAQLFAQHLEQRVVHGREALPVLAVHPQLDPDLVHGARSGKFERPVKPGLYARIEHARGARRLLSLLRRPAEGRSGDGRGRLGGQEEGPGQELRRAGVARRVAKG